MAPSEKSAAASTNATEAVGENLDEAPAVGQRVRVKSRTGQPYIRCGRAWQANAWGRVEMKPEEVAILVADPWLDVVFLNPDDTVDETPRTPAEKLAAIETDNARLEAESARLQAENAKLWEELSAAQEELSKLKSGSLG